MPLWDTVKQELRILPEEIKGTLLGTAADISGAAYKAVGAEPRVTGAALPTAIDYWSEPVESPYTAGENEPRGWKTAKDVASMVTLAMAGKQGVDFIRSAIGVRNWNKAMSAADKMVDKAVDMAHYNMSAEIGPQLERKHVLDILEQKGTMDVIRTRALSEAFKPYAIDVNKAGTINMYSGVPIIPMKQNQWMQPMDGPEFIGEFLNRMGLIKSQDNIARWGGILGGFRNLDKVGVARMAEIAQVPERFVNEGVQIFKQMKGAVTPPWGERERAPLNEPVIPETPATPMPSKTVPDVKEMGLEELEQPSIPEGIKIGDEVVIKGGTSFHNFGTKDVVRVISFVGDKGAVRARDVNGQEQVLRPQDFRLPGEAQPAQQRHVSTDDIPRIADEVLREVGLPFQVADGGRVRKIALRVQKMAAEGKNREQMIDGLKVGERNWERGLIPRTILGRPGWANYVEKLIGRVLGQPTKFELTGALRNPPVRPAPAPASAPRPQRVPAAPARVINIGPRPDVAVEKTNKIINWYHKAFSKWWSEGRNGTYNDPEAPAFDVIFKNRKKPIAIQLKNEPIKEAHRLGGGIERTYKIKLSGGRTAVLKESHDAGGRRTINVDSMAQREVVAYRIAKLMGLDIVPITNYRKVSGKIMSAQDFIENGKIAHRIAGAEWRPIINEAKNDIIAMELFHYVFGDTDAHGGNWMVYQKNNKWKATKIDNGLHMSPTEKYSDTDYGGELRHHIGDTIPIPKKVFRAFKKLYDRWDKAKEELETIKDLKVRRPQDLQRMHDDLKKLVTTDEPIKSSHITFERPR